MKNNYSASSCVYNTHISAWGKANVIDTKMVEFTLTETNIF